MWVVLKCFGIEINEVLGSGFWLPEPCWQEPVEGRLQG